MVPSTDLYWHTLPLHYVPHLLTSGFLLSSARLAKEAPTVVPRPSAIRRRRKLGLTHYIHLSFIPRTPLLIDKRAQGFPHALLSFPQEIDTLPGAAFCRYNQLAWRHRDDFAPITEPSERAEFLQLRSHGKFPSAELLIPDQLALAFGAQLYLASPAELDWLTTLSAVLALPTLPTHLDPELFPHAPELDLSALESYAHTSIVAGCVLPPPPLRFD